jgi:SAM-dependent methyltransferase
VALLACPAVSFSSLRNRKPIFAVKYFPFGSGRHRLEGTDMKLTTILGFLSRSPLRLLRSLEKTSTEFFRATFVSAGLTEGIFEVLKNGPLSPEGILKALGATGDPEKLKAWLDLGVSLGELESGPQGYGLKGVLSRGLSDDANDTWRAYLIARVEVFYRYILKTPEFITQGRTFEEKKSHGELFARSSRTVEPLIVRLLEDLIPRNQAVRLLEVGCGSGIYLEKVCALNPELIAVGLELQRDVAQYAADNIRLWGLDDRVSVETSDIRDYSAERDFDIVTFHNLIYYFPVQERVELLGRLGGLLKPGGKLILTTLCQDDNPAVQLMNVWASMTDGCGTLPTPDQLASQLCEAGFADIKASKELFAFHLFEAKKPV